MDTKAALAADERDIRLYLFLGIANWFIFLDHMPRNSLRLITIRNFGFSGAADIFIFISGFIATLAFGRIMQERGFIVGATRLFKRAWQLYIAYVILFVIYVVTIGDMAARYAIPDLIYEFNISGLVDHPIKTLRYGLFLEATPLNLDALQLYIILIALFAPALWALLRRPNLAMAGSIMLYLAARQFEWNLPSFPYGDLYFNPFCWQLQFVFGGWVALGGAGQFRELLNSRILPYLGATFLVFALIMTMAARFPELGRMLPGWLFDAFIPNDRMNLAPYRVVHFIVLACFVTRFLPKDWPGLQSPVLQPLIRCGEQSVAVFCFGVFLSFFGHFILISSSDSLAIQLFVAVAGIAIMTLLAYYLSWSQQQDALAKSGIPSPRARLIPEFRGGELDRISSQAPAE